MRKFTLLCGVVGLLASSSASFAAAGIDAGFDLSLAGKYAWRGVDKGPTGLVGKAYATKALWKGWSLTGKVSNYTMLDAGKGIAEASYDVGLTWDLGIDNGWFKKTQVSLGWLYLDRCNNPGSAAFQGDDTQEAYLGLAWPTRAWGWSPWVKVNYDFDRGDGSAWGDDQVGLYVAGGIGKSFKLSNGWMLDTAARVGLDFGRGIDIYRDAAITTGLRWQLEKGLTFGPVIDWTFPSHEVDPTARAIRIVPALTFSYNRSY
ncbi:MAG: hypothetical protein IT204_12775 [Fimbriimonadaceae bacterium]|nr:hypothetical protein [Fimbriimonadaceae bacterium]